MPTRVPEIVPPELNPPETIQQPLARSAGILFVGNMGSRILGLVREIVIAYFFGASGQVSAFRVASQVPTMLYEFLVGGMLSAALVPVLSDYLRTRSRQEFTRLVGTLLGVFSVLLAMVLVLLELSAPYLARVMAGGFTQFDPTLLPLTVQLIRLLSPAVWLFGMGGVLTAILYAQERFTFPAIATAIYNLGIVIAAPLLADRIGIMSLAIGVLLGSLAQLVLMWWDVVRSRLRVQLSLDWNHPALRKILLLYTPIAAGLIVSLGQVILDRNLASRTGEQSIAWMANATTLQQMPLGLISVAISLAALPRLSQFYAAHDEASYRHTLGRGLRMVLLLIAPAAVVMWLLGTPITRLLFEHGDFTPEDSVQVASALNIYLLGMLFAAIDFPLNFAFYARNNTLLPALVGVFSVLVYVVVAFALITPLGYFGLIWADTAKHGSHAALMIFFLHRRVGRLDASLRWGVLQILGAGLAMAATLLALEALMPGIDVDGWLGEVVFVSMLSLVGITVYGLVLYAFGLAEVRQLVRSLSARYRRPL